MYILNRSYLCNDSVFASALMIDPLDTVVDKGNEMTVLVNYAGGVLLRGDAQTPHLGPTPFPLFGFLFFP